MKRYLSTTQPDKGFTLIEAIIVIAILATGIAIATPSFISHVQRSEISRTAQSFHNALEEAKRTAYISGRAFTVCPVKDITTSKPICLQNWEIFNGTDKTESKGWIVFHDRNNNNILDNNETLNSRSMINSNIVALIWTRKNAIITLSPRNTTGSTGTMRIYAHQRGKLPAWHGTSTPIASNLHETRITLSSLGRVKQYK